jgi:hypothetical protein
MRHSVMPTDQILVLSRSTVVLKKIGRLHEIVRLSSAFAEHSSQAHLQKSHLRHGLLRVVYVYSRFDIRRCSVEEHKNRKFVSEVLLCSHKCCDWLARNTGLGKASCQ